MCNYVTIAAGSTGIKPFMYTYDIKVQHAPCIILQTAILLVQKTSKETLNPALIVQSSVLLVSEILNN